MKTGRTTSVEAGVDTTAHPLSLGYVGVGGLSSGSLLQSSAKRCSFASRMSFNSRTYSENFCGSRLNLKLAAKHVHTCSFLRGHLAPPRKKGDHQF